jgi:hypothetical protein
MAVAKWLGRADAVVVSHSPDQIEWRFACEMLTANRIGAIEKIKLLLFRALAGSELASPPAARGAFIPVGSTYDAFAALSKLLAGATREVLIIDPYMNETVLSEYGTVVPAGITLRLLTDAQFDSAGLRVACQRWQQQNGAVRPLQARESPRRALHDRAVIVDGREAWTLTQSLKDFARRSPAEIVSAGDIAELKIPAYEEIWARSTVIV